MDVRVTKDYKNIPLGSLIREVKLVNVFGKPFYRGLFVNMAYSSYVHVPIENCTEEVVNTNYVQVTPIQEPDLYLIYDHYDECVIAMDVKFSDIEKVIQKYIDDNCTGDFDDFKVTLYKNSGIQYRVESAIKLIPITN